MKKKMQKKADLEISTLIEIIIFAAIFLIIILPIIMYTWNYFTEKPDSGTIKSFDALVIESNNLKNEKEVPIYINTHHTIKAFPEGAGPIDKCKGTGCICICNEENKCEPCKSIEHSFLKQYTIKPALSREKKATLQNCLLKIEKDVISISKCV